MRIKRQVIDKETFRQMGGANGFIESYLTVEQAKYLNSILAVLKPEYADELCIALMDYMETGMPMLPANSTLGAFFMQLTRVGLSEYDDPKDKRIIRPLNYKFN